MNYNYSELIHRYMDGMLPEEHERVLFDELARNPNLRRDFALELDLQNAASGDKAALIPPDSIRMGVFSALNIPLTTEVAEIGSAASPQLLTFTSIALVSMIFGGMMVWLGMKDNNNTAEQLLAKNAVTKLIAPPETNKESSQLPDNSISPTIASHRVVSSKHSTIFTNTPQQLLPENTTQVLPVSIQSTPIPQNTTAARKNPDRSSLYFAENITIPQLFDLQTDIPMSISMRGLQDFTGSTGAALSAQYALDEEQSLGVEVSTAQFTHSEHRKIGGIDKIVSLNQKSTVIGAVYRISLPSMNISECIPYIQSFAGATTKGLPVARTTVGLQWTPDRRVTLSGGIDGTIFGYTTNGVWKAGVSTGFVYGVSVVL